MGQRIARLRERAGLSQPALADAAGIKQPSLWAIEAGRTVEVTARTLLSLCRALHTTVDYVWDGSTGAADPESEAELVAIYRQLTPPARLAVLQSARTVLAAVPPPTPSPPPPLARVPAPAAANLRHPPQALPPPAPRRPQDRKRKA